MNAITELAMLLKDRENGAAYSPVFGRIAELPDVKIKVGDKILLSDGHIKKICEIHQQDEFGNYINLNKEAVLLPFSNGQKYILMGVVVP